MSCGVAAFNRWKFGPHKTVAVDHYNNVRRGMIVVPELKMRQCTGVPSGCPICPAGIGLEKSGFLMKLPPLKLVGVQPPAMAAFNDEIAIVATTSSDARAPRLNRAFMGRFMRLLCCAVKPYLTGSIGP